MAQFQFLDVLLNRANSNFSYRYYPLVLIEKKTTTTRHKRMLTIRKLAILVAGIFFLILFALRQSPSSPSLIRHPHSSSDHSKSGGSGKTKTEIEKILENANRPLKSADEFSSLREHLEYLFPYEGPSATKFPAYIWQTWKYTPAMGEFDERFRVTEASWTERHPDYVHEVPPYNVIADKGINGRNSRYPHISFIWNRPIGNGSLFLHAHSYPQSRFIQILDPLRPGRYLRRHRHRSPPSCARLAARDLPTKHSRSHRRHRS